MKTDFVLDVRKESRIVGRNEARYGPVGALEGLVRRDLRGTGRLPPRGWRSGPRGGQTAAGPPRPASHGHSADRGVAKEPAWIPSLLTGGCSRAFKEKTP